MDDYKQCPRCRANSLRGAILVGVGGPQCAGCGDFLVRIEGPPITAERAITTLAEAFDDFPEVPPPPPLDWASDDPRSEKEVASRLWEARPNVIDVDVVDPSVEEEAISSLVPPSNRIPLGKITAGDGIPTVEDIFGCGSPLTVKL